MKGRVSGKRRYGFGSVDPIKGDIPDIFNTRRPGAGARSHFTASTSTAARAASSRSPALLQHALLRRRLALALHRLHRRPHLPRLPAGSFIGCCGCCCCCLLLLLLRLLLLLLLLPLPLLPPRHLSPLSPSGGIEVFRENDPWRFRDFFLAWRRSSAWRRWRTGRTCST
jgi:hypothetical protein